jgi:hypothetical protein
LKNYLDCLFLNLGEKYSINYAEKLEGVGDFFGIYGGSCGDF